MTNNDIKKEKETKQELTMNDESNIKNMIPNLHKKAGFLPPQALPPPPPPPPIPNEDTSALLSPWWSEETTATEDITSSANTIETTIKDQQQQQKEVKQKEEEGQQQPQQPQPQPQQNTKSSSSNNNIISTDSTITTETTTAAATTQPDSTTITLLGFGRTSKTKGEWNEKCYMLATTQGGKSQQKQQQQQNDKENFQQEFRRLTEKSKDCTMVCFLKESKRLTQQRRRKADEVEKESLVSSFWDQHNPFYGTWITVTKTPSKCREHLETEYIQKKNQSDYYTMELGDGLDHTGEYVKNAIINTFGPLHRLGERYIDSWKNGNQQAFFTRFVDSLKRGDGIYLVRDSTKRLVENALGEHNKKQPPNDNKNK